MSYFADVRQAIIDKINSGAITLIQVAYRTPRSTFSGYPAAVVMPSDSEADYGSTERDKVTMVFQVRIYYPVKKESEYDDAEIALEGAVDEMLDAFKERNVLGAACDWVAPAPSVWAWDGLGEAVYRVATITLRCTKQVQNV